MPRANVATIARTRAIQSSAAQSTSAPLARALDDKPALSPEAKRHYKTRVRKAEQGELRTLHALLSDTKDFMGGFTGPKSLRAANWSDGAPYVTENKVYESPDPVAYKPRTVYVLEGRHPTVYGHGRVDTYEKSDGVCTEAALPQIVQRANSPAAPNEFKQPMDAARWPWDPARKRGPVQWWEAHEDPEALRLQALEDALAGVQPAPQTDLPKEKLSKRARAARVPTELLASRGSGMQTTSARHFHSSSAALLPDDPGSFDSRRNIPGSTWSRPPRPSQDAKDDVVPTYYVERKKQRDDISQRKEQEGSLMAELNAGILSEGLAAKTRVRDEKIPVEVRLPDGTIAHPSGFEPPTAETDFHPVAAKVPTEDHPLLATVKQPWDDREFPVPPTEPVAPDAAQEQEWLKRVAAGAAADGSAVLTGVRDIGAETRVASSATLPTPGPTTHADRSKITTSAWDSPAKGKSRRNDPPEDVVPPFYIERKKQRSQIAERKEEEGGLMAELNAGILSEDLAAQTREREEKIPVEVVLEDGTIVHPSGFVPPTPETEFHPAAAKPPDSPKLPWTEIDSVKGAAPIKDVSSGKKPGDARGYHTSAVARATVLPMALPGPIQAALAKQGRIAPDQDAQATLEARRAQYMPTLQREPFWRPLLTVTVATRPLAQALQRAAGRFPRGQPFVSAIEDADRKEFGSYNSRLRTLRVERMRAAVEDVARRLGGAHGGLIGMRTNAAQRGRGVNGEGLADPLPREARVVKIGVGEWYPFAEEVKERFLDDAARGGYAEFVEVFGVDEWGNRTDGKVWAGEKPKTGEVLIEKEFADELDVD